MFRIDRRMVNLTPAGQVIIRDDEQPAGEPAGPAPDDGGVSSADRRSGDRMPLPDDEEIAETLVEQAEIEAALKIQEAQERADDIREQARRDGYEEGRAEAARELEDMKARQLDRQKEDAAQLKRVLAEVERERDAMIDELEEDFIQLSLATAKKIINAALENDDTLIESMLQKALQQMKTDGKLTIRVSNAEFERFFSAGSASFVLGDGTVTASVVEESSMAPGDIVLESEGETIDAGVDSQLKKIELAFRQIRDKHRREQAEGERNE